MYENLALTEIGAALTELNLEGMKGAADRAVKIGPNVSRIINRCVGKRLEGVEKKYGGEECFLTKLVTAGHVRKEVMKHIDRTRSGRNTYSVLKREGGRLA